MANRSQTTRRPASARFARPGGTSGRSARPSATSNRFARPGTTGRAASARRPATASRRPTVRRRPEKTGMAKIAAGVTGLLPGKKTSSKGGGKGRTAGLALLAGAAGLAFKNREKLPGLGGPKGSGTGDRTAHADAPANPIVVDAQPQTAPPAT